MCGEWLREPGGTGMWRFASLSTWVYERGQCASVVVTQMPGLWASCDVHLCTHTRIWVPVWLVPVHAKLSVCLCPRQSGDTYVCWALGRCVLGVLYRGILFRVCCVCLACAPGFLCLYKEGSTLVLGHSATRGPDGTLRELAGVLLAGDTRRIKGWRSGWCVVCVCRCAVGLCGPQDLTCRPESQPRLHCSIAL